MDTQALRGPEGRSCWTCSPSASNPVNLRAGLLRGETLSSHLNIYGQPGTFCQQSLPHSSRLPSPFILPSFSSPLSFLICDTPIHCLPQEVFPRPMQLSVTTTVLAAKRKFSGWGCRRMRLRNFSVCSRCAARSKATIRWFYLAALSLRPVSLVIVFPFFPLITSVFSSVSGCRHHLPLSGQQRVQFTGFQPPRQQVTHFTSDFRNDSKHAAIKIWLLVLKWKRNNLLLTFCKILKMYDWVWTQFCFQVELKVS